MKHITFGLVILSLISIVLTDTSIAQKDKNNRNISSASSLYVISAKAGVVNLVSGNVTVAKQGSKSGNLLKGDNLEVGDKISTGIDGKTEILLNPGSYVRLASNAEFEFITTSLDDLQLKLTSGSGMFEVIADKEFKITVVAGTSRFYLIDSGIYRIDVLENGVGKISVWKGKVQVGDIKATKVKGGKSATLTDGQVVVAKFDKDNKSELEIWSKDRAKEIAKINEKLLQRDMNRSLMSTFGQNGFNGFGGYGLWVFDASSRTSCFLPYSYGWSSPYGYNYNQSIWSYSAPANVFYNTVQNQNGNYNNGQQFPNISTPNVQTPNVNLPPSIGSGMGNNPSSVSGGDSRGTDLQTRSNNSSMDRKTEQQLDSNPRKID